MISGIVGLPGHGKTLEAVRRAVLAHRGGAHIYANIPLNLERSTLVTPDGAGGTVALSSVRRGACECGCREVFVLLDEVHLWLPARRSLQLPISWLALFSQTRKMGWELWWTAQHETRVDRMLRDVTSVMYIARGWQFIVEFYVYTWWFADDFRNPRKRGSRDVRRRSRSASAAYNTTGSVTGATHLTDARDPYAPMAGMAAPTAASGVRPSGAGPRPLRPLDEDTRQVVVDLLRDELVDEQPARPQPASAWRY